MEVYWRFRVACCPSSQWIRLKTAVTTRRHIAKDSILYRQRHEHLRSDVCIARTMPTSWINLTLPFRVFKYRISDGNRTQAHGKWRLSWGQRSSFYNLNCDLCEVWVEAKETVFVIETDCDFCEVSWGQRNSFDNWNSVLCEVTSWILKKTASIIDCKCRVSITDIDVLVAATFPVNGIYCAGL